NSYQQSLSYSNNASEAQTVTEEISESIDEWDGFIQTGFTITNTSSVQVQVKGLRAIIELVGIENVGQSRVIESDTLRKDQNSYVSSTFVPPPAASAQSATPASAPAPELELDLAPGASYTQNIIFTRVNS